jgi:hypothetical protein
MRVHLAPTQPLVRLQPALPHGPRAPVCRAAPRGAASAQGLSRSSGGGRPGAGSGQQSSGASGGASNGAASGATRGGPRKPLSDDYMPRPRPLPGPPGSRRAAREALAERKRAEFGPHAADFDVRLYLMRRAANARRGGGTARGGFPLDDSLPREGTAAKLLGPFRAQVCESPASDASGL